MEIIRKKSTLDNFVKVKKISNILDFININTQFVMMNVCRDLREKLILKKLNKEILKVIKFLISLLKNLETFKRFLFENSIFVKEIKRLYPEISEENIMKGMSYSFQMIIDGKFHHSKKDFLKILKNYKDKNIFSFFDILPQKYKILFRFVVYEINDTNESQIKEYLQKIYRMKLTNSSEKFNNLISKIDRNSILLTGLEIVEHQETNIYLIELFKFLNLKKNYLTHLSLSYHSNFDKNSLNEVNIVDFNSDSLIWLKLDIDDINKIKNLYESMVNCKKLKTLIFSHSHFDNDTFLLESVILNVVLKLSFLRDLRINFHNKEFIIEISNINNSNLNFFLIPSIYPEEKYNFFIDNHNLTKISLKTVELVELRHLIQPFFDSLKLKTRLKSFTIEINQQDEHFEIFENLIFCLKSKNNCIKKLVVNTVSKTIKKKLIDQIIELLKINKFIKKIRFRKSEYNIFLGKICKFSVSRIIQEMLQIILILAERNYKKKHFLSIKYFIDVDLENTILNYKKSWKDFPTLINLINNIEIVGIKNENFENFIELLFFCKNIRNLSFLANISNENWLKFNESIKSLELLEHIMLNYNECKEENIINFITKINKQNLTFLSLSHNILSKKSIDCLINLNFPHLKLLSISNLDEKDTNKEEYIELINVIFATNHSLLTVILDGEFFHRINN